LVSNINAEGTEVRVLSSALCLDAAPADQRLEHPFTNNVRTRDQDQTGMLKIFKKVMPIFDVPLSTANSIYNVSVVVLIGGIALVFISSISVIWSGVIRERYASARISHNEAVAAQAGAALQKALDDAAGVEKQLAQAREAAAASAAAAAATLEQEKAQTQTQAQPSSWRQITPENRSLFKTFVKNFAKGRIFVDAEPSDPEAINYARQLSDLLTESGYPVVQKNNLPEPAGGFPSGVHVRIKSMDAQPSYAGALQKGLEYIDIDTSGELDDAAEDSVLILIGSKP
jgi:hypothetical protein